MAFDFFIFEWLPTYDVILSFNLLHFVAHRSPEKFTSPSKRIGRIISEILKKSQENTG
ncbi:hypothetical protein HanXRQr2_Chr13g0606931 [Helianthus annuus]|uniref:Uncharacterized protein n=1 Tax=Helianthus annuus TaxID=4232 RepID=A0A251SVJ6_HELAN|nr:hypothetical protein HanXRQr2_Chr13g0606931 [Helianthus annuus]KAJ0850810.1 hypothetical protein HanPSC8_Chr13g0585151 [Helianthus annuus]